MSSAVSFATSVSKRPNRFIPLARWRNDFSPYLGYAFYSSHHTPDRPTTGKTKTGDISPVRRLMSECIPKEVSIDSKAVERRLLTVLRRSRVDDSRVIVQHSYTGESVRPLDLRSIYCYTGAQLDDMFQIKNDHSGAAGSETLESRLGSLIEETGVHQAKEENTGATDANTATFSMLGGSMFRDSYDSNLHREKEQSSDAIWVQQPCSLAQMVRLSCSTSSLSSLLFSSQDAKGPSSPSNCPDPDSNRPTVSQLEAVQTYLNEYTKGFFVKVSDYRPCHLNIEFENNLFQKRVVTKGIAAYIIQLKKYVIIAHLKYINVRMHVLKITIDETEGTVIVRWRVSGLPQAKIFQFWKFLPGRFMRNMNEQSEWFDGISTFYVGKDGLIHKHKADRVIPDKSVEVKQVNPLPANLAGSA